eukprot:1162036-Pelagomonas_calceolata.AAC.6
MAAGGSWWQLFDAPCGEAQLRCTLVIIWYVTCPPEIENTTYLIPHTSAYVAGHRTFVPRHLSSIHPSIHHFNCVTFLGRCSPGLRTAWQRRALFARTRHQRSSSLIKVGIKGQGRVDAGKASKQQAVQGTTSHQTGHQRTGQTECRQGFKATGSARHHLSSNWASKDRAD